MVSQIVGLPNILEKKDELERYPYDEKGYDTRSSNAALKKGSKVSEHTMRHGESSSPQSFPSSPSTVEESSTAQPSPILKANHYTSLPFLTPRYVVVNSRDRHTGVYLAKVLYHRSYVLKRNLWNAAYNRSY